MIFIAQLPLVPRMNWPLLPSGGEADDNLRPTALMLGVFPLSLVQSNYHVVTNGVDGVHPATVVRNGETNEVVVVTNRTRSAGSDFHPVPLSCAMNAVSIIGVFSAFSLFFLWLLMLCAEKSVHPFRRVRQGCRRLPVWEKTLLSIFVGMWIAFASVKECGTNGANQVECDTNTVMQLEGGPNVLGGVVQGRARSPSAPQGVANGESNDPALRCVRRGIRAGCCQVVAGENRKTMLWM